MNFEDIPEDKEESYPCPKCDSGNVTADKNGLNWVCDTCDYETPVMHEIG